MSVVSVAFGGVGEGGGVGTGEGGDGRDGRDGRAGVTGLGGGGCLYTGMRGRRREGRSGGASKGKGRCQSKLPQRGVGLGLCSEPHPTRHPLLVPRHGRSRDIQAPSRGPPTALSLPGAA